MDIIGLSYEHKDEKFSLTENKQINTEIAKV